MQEMGEVPEHEMYNTFNMGIGMVLAVSKDIAAQVLEEAQKLGEKAYIIGEVAKGEESIEIC
jgi:phosphoribosylformylglycinamidine cyclo-ligase